MPAGFAPNERVEMEINPSTKTVSYYALKAAPLFGVWFVGLLIFLLYSFKQKGGTPHILLLQALALAGFAMLIGVITRWLWRIDLSQREAWLTNLGVWVQGPSTLIFVPYNTISSVRVKEDWMQKWLHVDEIEINYTLENRPNKVSIVGVENPREIMERLHQKRPELA
jgi:hypothetical protein